MKQTNKLRLAFICGILGCLCFGISDWLMIYGDPSYNGSLNFLTEGVAQISSWRNKLSMILAFPGIIFYGTALFSIEALITDKTSGRIYRYLNAFGLTPWLCIHIFYVMIFYIFAWMNNNGYSDVALPLCESLYNHLSWIIITGELIMIPVYIYLFYLGCKQKVAMHKIMIFLNPILLYIILYIIKSLMPVSAFRIGFTNGLMSQSMIIWFSAMLVSIKNK